MKAFMNFKSKEGAVGRAKVEAEAVIIVAVGKGHNEIVVIADEDVESENACIANTAVMVLLEHMISMEGCRTCRAIRDLVGTCMGLVTARPEMANVLHAGLKVAVDLVKSGRFTAEYLKHLPSPWEEPL